MTKTTSSKTDSKPNPKPEAPTSEAAKRVSFFPFRPDLARLQKFADIFAEREGLTDLNVRPGQREVFRFILDCAEQGLTSSTNGDSHSPHHRRGKN